MESAAAVAGTRPDETRSERTFIAAHSPLCVEDRWLPTFRRAHGPRTPTLGTKADAARPPASRLAQVTTRFRAALTVAQGLLPSPCGSLAEGVVRGEHG